MNNRSYCAHFFYICNWCNFFIEAWKKPNIFCPFRDSDIPTYPCMVQSCYDVLQISGYRDNDRWNPKHFNVFFLKFSSLEFNYHLSSLSLSFFSSLALCLFLALSCVNPITRLSIFVYRLFRLMSNINKRGFCLCESIRNEGRCA